MSEPKSPLDYEPHSARPRATGVFVGRIILWSILTPCLVTGIIFGVAISGGASWKLAVTAAVTIAIVAISITGARRIRDPQRRSAAMTGMLIGIGVGLLIVGGCFAWLSRIEI